MPFRADPTKEYYAILGLTEGVTPEEIRKAYRKLALHYHPDRNRGEPGAEERFKAISEAYAVLIDPEKRRQYDLSLRVGVGATTGAPAGRGVYSNQEDILRDLLHNRDAAVIFEELAREFQRMGFRFDDGFVRHMFFGGRGFIFGGVFFGGPFAWGRGAEEEGYGIFRRRIETESPGLLTRLGQALREIIGGLGRAARFALGAGERGGDLNHDLSLTPEEARHGTRKHVRLARGAEIDEVVVTVPAGVRPGSRLRLRGKGLVGTSGVPGDLYLRIQVVQ